MKMQDKIVVVVGSTSGIGKAMVEAYAAEGAVAVVTGRRAELGLKIVADIQSTGGKADFFAVDATSLESCNALIDNVVAKYGKIDVLVYNAGIAPSCNVSTTDEATWDRVMGTNLKAAFFMVQHALPHLAASKGNVLFTSSLAGESARNATGNVVYGSGKAATGHMVEILALAASKDGVRVNAVAPGVTMTDILANASPATMEYLKKSIPLQCLGLPEDIATAALFLTSDDAKFITGQVLRVDGGASIS